jgi:hypothetical protein
VINIAVVLLFAISLVYFNQELKLKRVTNAIIYMILFLFIFIQYQTYHPFQGFEHAKFSYNNSPQGYFWLKEQKDIKSIVEYPIEKAAEANSQGYYLSMQIVHKKPMLNSVLSNSPDEPVRSSIKNLYDPQTIPVLHTLGVNAIVIHGVDPAEIEKIPHLAVIYKETPSLGTRLPESPAITKNFFVIAKILDDAPLPINSIQFLDNFPRNSTIQTSAIDWQYEVPTGSRIAYLKIPTKSTLAISRQANVGEVCFMVKMALLGDSGQLVIKDNKNININIDIDDQYKNVRFATDVNDVIKLKSSNGHNMRLTNIGCE